ncbi:MAG: hypothetical protein GKR94_19230 [Gammaproteobacteria bacterium]|nr:hypothetical protein [Gammaproteobacteria bacterium]
MKVTRVCDALSMALMRRSRPDDVIVHRDRGSQSCAKRCHDLLAEHGLHASMSQRGGGCDNAAARSANPPRTFAHGKRVA